MYTTIDQLNFSLTESDRIRNLILKNRINFISKSGILIKYAITCL